MSGAAEGAGRGRSLGAPLRTVGAPPGARVSVTHSGDDPLSQLLGAGGSGGGGDTGGAPTGGRSVSDSHAAASPASRSAVAASTAAAATTTAGAPRAVSVAMDGTASVMAPAPAPVAAPPRVRSIETLTEEFLRGCTVPPPARTEAAARTPKGAMSLARRRSWKAVLQLCNDMLQKYPSHSELSAAEAMQVRSLQLTALYRCRMYRELLTELGHLGDLDGPSYVEVSPQTGLRETIVPMQLRVLAAAVYARAQDSQDRGVNLLRHMLQRIDAFLDATVAKAEKDAAADTDGATGAKTGAVAAAAAATEETKKDVVAGEEDDRRATEAESGNDVGGLATASESSGPGTAVLLDPMLCGMPIKHVQIWRRRVLMQLASIFASRQQWRIALGYLEIALQDFAAAMEQYQARSSSGGSVAAPVMGTHLFDATSLKELGRGLIDTHCRIARIFLMCGALSSATRSMEHAQASMAYLQARVGPDPRATEIVELNTGLLRFASSDYAGAVASFQSALDLIKNAQEDSTTDLSFETSVHYPSADLDDSALLATATNNFAIASLYTCRLQLAVQTLEDLVRESPPRFMTESLVFNLCTMYDLSCPPASSANKKHVLKAIGIKFGLEDLPGKCFRM